jgi:hypothetical protein
MHIKHFRTWEQPLDRCYRLKSLQISNDRRHLVRRNPNHRFAVHLAYPLRHRLLLADRHPKAGPHVLPQHVAVVGLGGGFQDLDRLGVAAALAAKRCTRTCLAAAIRYGASRDAVRRCRRTAPKPRLFHFCGNGWLGNYP